MKKILIILAISLLLAANVNALQEVAGAILINVPLGSSNSTQQFGLLNDGNQTITVNLTADGGAAQYLSFPTTVTLEPGKLTYTNITATLPSNPNDLKPIDALIITGNIYATQEGAPGQVQINVQMKKKVSIQVMGATIEQPKQDPIIAILTSNYFIIAVGVILVVALFLLYNSTRKKVTKERLDEAKKGDDKNEQKNISDSNNIDDNNNDS